MMIKFDFSGRVLQNAAALAALVLLSMLGQALLR